MTPLLFFKFCILKGFNTGVVLFDLERMRQSAEYNGFLEAEEVARVMNKYGYHVSLGDQDWFTNIGFEVSGLILIGKFDRFYFSVSGPILQTAVSVQCPDLSSILEVESC